MFSVMGIMLLEIKNSFIYKHACRQCRQYSNNILRLFAWTAEWIAKQICYCPICPSVTLFLIEYSLQLRMFQHIAHLTKHYWADWNCFGPFAHFTLLSGPLLPKKSKLSFWHEKDLNLRVVSTNLTNIQFSGPFGPHFCPVYLLLTHLFHLHLHLLWPYIFAAPFRINYFISPVLTGHTTSVFVFAH